MKAPLIFLIFFLVSCSSTKSELQKSSIQNLDPGNPPQWVFYPAKGDVKNKHIVMISGDEEYRSEEALPQFAKILAEHHGFDCTVLFAQDPDNPGIVDPNYSFNIPGLEQLENADLMVLFTRFRDLPAEQMSHIDKYLLEGKPVFALRTSTHAFKFKDENHPFAHYGWNYKGDNADWQLGLGKTILGESWFTHHGRHKHQSTRGIIAAGAENHPVLSGIKDGDIWGPSDVYGIREPMPDDSQPIVLGQSIDRAGEYMEGDPRYGMKESDTKIATQSNPDHPEKSYNPNEKMPPIVWTKSYQLESGKKGRSVTSTIGSAVDMLDDDVRRMMVNSIYFLSDMKVLEKADVSIVGDFVPSAFQFQSNEYWDEKNMKVPTN